MLAVLASNFSSCCKFFLDRALRLDNSRAPLVGGGLTDVLSHGGPCCNSPRPGVRYSLAKSQSFNLEDW